MSMRERKILIWFLAVLCACSALGTLVVVTKSGTAQVDAFAQRFADFTSITLTAPPAVTLSTEAHRLTAAWPQAADGFTVQTGKLPLRAGADHAQVDVYVGGTQNTAEGGEPLGFRAYLTLTLWQGDTALRTAREVLTLASAKERQRLYSLRADGRGANACTIAWVVEPTGGSLPEGTLTCAWLEVLP